MTDKEVQELYDEFDRKLEELRLYLESLFMRPLIEVCKGLAHAEYQHKLSEIEKFEDQFWLQHYKDKEKMRTPEIIPIAATPEGV